MIPRGVRLEQNKRDSLKHAVRRVQTPQGFPAPLSFAPAKKNTQASEIMAAAKTAAIADETDGELLERKLAGFAKRKTVRLVALCFDDDPYASCGQAVLRENAVAVADGLALAAKACGAKEVFLAVASRGEARRATGHGVETPCVAAGRLYPAAFLLMQKLCRHGVSAAYVGAQACAALSDAVRNGRPQSETVVTVAGDCVKKPGNYRVRIGAPLAAVMEAAGADDAARLLAVGSSLAGQSVRDPQTPVAATTRLVLVMKKPLPQQQFPCVRCGRCARACPVGVVPWLVHRELEGGAPDAALLFHVGECIGCRACAAVCPSRIELPAEVKRAAKRKEGGADE